jgi:hypothetical protein
MQRIDLQEILDLGDERAGAVRVEPVDEHEIRTRFPRLADEGGHDHIVPRSAQEGCRTAEAPPLLVDDQHP